MSELFPWGDNDQRLGTLRVPVIEIRVQAVVLLCSMKLASKLPILILTLALMATAVAIGSWLTMSTFRRALPAGVEDVREYIHEDGFLPDYAYCLRAELAEAEFAKYVGTLKLERGQPEDISGAYACPEAWWTPPKEPLHTFVHQETHTRVTAVFDGRYVYLWAVSM